MQSDYSGLALELSGASTLGNAARWIEALLTGNLAAGLCILAITVVGALMLGGRLPVRNALHVFLGCFILLGAPVISAGLMNLGENAIHRVDGIELLEMERDQLRELPRADYDPYAGASLRQD